MADLRLTRAPAAKTAMLIRRPAAEVFEAFADPTVTTRFWFTKSSGRLQPGARVVWEWEMYGHSAPVDVREVEPNRRIVIEWPGEGGPSRVEWTFDDRGDGTTFVSITNDGFAGGGDALVRQALDSTEGFALVLSAAKALLEHGIELNTVGDRFPGGTGEE